MTANEQSPSNVTVGILYPGHSAEDDYPKIESLLGGTVELPLVHTELHSDDHTIEAMKAAGDQEALANGARELVANHKLNAIIWACTSGSFAYGWEEAEKQADELQAVAGVPASSTSFAFVDAIKHIGVQKVAVAATYPLELADTFRTFLGHAGIEVVGLASHDIFTASEVGQSVGRDEVLAFAAAAAESYPAAEAILIPDTAMHTVEWLEDLEAHVGKPVLTANQVSVWKGMQLAGAAATRSGLGKLFRS